MKSWDKKLEKISKEKVYHLEVWIESTKEREREREEGERERGSGDKQVDQYK